MVNENILENVRSRSETLLAGLQNLKEKHPEVISNIRGKGLMCAFDLPDTEIRNNMVSEILKNGAIILPCGDRSIRFRPPLNITDEEIQMGLDIISKSLAKLI